MSAWRKCGRCAGNGYSIHLTVPVGRAGVIKTETTNIHCQYCAGTGGLMVPEVCDIKSALVDQLAMKLPGSFGPAGTPSPVEVVADCYANVLHAKLMEMARAIVAGCLEPDPANAAPYTGNVLADPIPAEVPVKVALKRNGAPWKGPET